MPPLLRSALRFSHPHLFPNRSAMPEPTIFSMYLINRLKHTELAAVFVAHAASGLAHRGSKYLLMQHDLCPVHFDYRNLLCPCHSRKHNLPNSTQENFRLRNWLRHGESRREGQSL